MPVSRKEQAMSESGVLIAIFILSIPIIAIVGGIISGIVKSISQHRLVELAQRERIAAIEHGIDPDKLPPITPLPSPTDELGLSPQEHDRRLSQGLMIGGIVTLAVGIGLAIFLSQVEEGLWTVGLIPGGVGVALLVSVYLLRSRNGSPQPPSPATPPR